MKNLSITTFRNSRKLKKNRLQLPKKNFERKKMNLVAKSNLKKKPLVAKFSNLVLIFSQQSFLLIRRRRRRRSFRLGLVWFRLRLNQKSSLLIRRRRRRRSFGLSLVWSRLRLGLVFSRRTIGFCMCIGTIAKTPGLRLLWKTRRKVHIIQKTQEMNQEPKYA